MYYGVSGSQYSLGATPIKSGGEGSIYTVQGCPNCLVKIYHPGLLNTELEEKLRTMYQNPPSPDVLAQIAWPIDVVYDADGKFAGFLMNKLSVTHDLDQVYKYPATDLESVTLRHKLIIAQNICYVIAGVHKAGYVFGDFNPMNIGININDGTVAFFDADTYHFRDPKSGKTHRCRAGCPGYVAPELLSNCKRFQATHPNIKETYANTPLPTFTEETDNFALAIHIFKLIMNGFTPYNGIPETSPVSQASPGRDDVAVERNSYCFAQGKRPMAVAMPEYNSLPTYIQDMFTRAFEKGYSSPSLRPSAEEWMAPLAKYEQELKQCGSNRNHFYYNKLSSCPYCAADSRYKIEINKAMNTQVGGGQKRFTSAPIVQRPVVPPPSGARSSSGTAHSTGSSTYRASTANAGTSGHSGSSMSTGLKVLIGAILAIIAFIFFSVMSNVDRDTVTIINDDFSISVGQTAEVRIRSSAPRLTADWNSCVDAEWNNDKSSGNMYYINLTGLSPGTCTLKIYKTANEDVFDTVNVTVIEEVSNEGGLTDAEVSPSSTNIIMLSDLDSWNKSDFGIGPWTYQSITDNMGDVYESYYSSDEGWAEYILNNEYATLEGKFVIENNYRSSTQNSHFRVYGDGQLLYGATITGGMKPIEFRIDISDVDIMRIELDSGTGSGGYAFTDLVDVHLCKSGYSYLDDSIPVEKIYPNGSTSLASLTWWNRSEYFGIGPYSYEPTTDNAGNTYYEYFCSESGWQEYAIEGKYTLFSGRLMMETNDSREGTINIYGDDELLYSVSVSGQQEPIDFSVDITGVQYLKIALTSPRGYGGAELANLVSAYLV